MPFGLRFPGLVLTSLALLCLHPGAAAGPSTQVEELPALWRSVDAVVHLQIQTRLGARSGSGETNAAFQEYEAKVFEVFRRYFAGPKRTLTLLETATGSDPVCKPGEEFVAFLRWDESERAFQSVVMVPVRDGQVKSPRIQGIESGMKLQAFLAQLRAMME